MPSKKPAREPAPTPKRGRPSRKGAPLNIRLIPGLKEALDQFVATLRPRIGITAYVEDLIERDLIAKGFWKAEACVAGVVAAVVTSLPLAM